MAIKVEKVMLPLWQAFCDDCGWSSNPAPTETDGENDARDHEANCPAVKPEQPEA